MVFQEVHALARADIVGSFTHYRFRLKDQFWGSNTKNQLPRWFLSAILSLCKICVPRYALAHFKISQLDAFSPILEHFNKFRLSLF